jgi:hypothetical protein
LDLAANGNTSSGSRAGGSPTKLSLLYFESKKDVCSFL